MKNYNKLVLENKRGCIGKSVVQRIPIWYKLPNISHPYTLPEVDGILTLIKIELAWETLEMR